jgi:hypothetical protein
VSASRLLCVRRCRMATKQQRKICKVRGCGTKWRSASSQLCYKHRNADAVKAAPARQLQCTVSGCSGEVLAVGLCSEHQYGLYKQMTSETLAAIELLIVSWVSPDEDGCWIWHGRKKDGYSHLLINGRWNSVHRWLYMHLVGQIPNAHELHHECEKPACVRPGHLQPLTPARHRDVTTFSTWMFGVVPTAVLGIENTSRTEAERMFAMLYGLPSDLSALEEAPEHSLSGSYS